MKPFFIFDLDGTLALNKHREHLAKAGQWDAFFKACDRDSPNAPVIEIFNRIAGDLDVEVEIWSGRSAAVLAKTLDWLIEHTAFDPQEHTIRMRPVGDHTPDEVLKKRWLDELHPTHRDDLLAVFDDRDKVVKMWRDNGVACFQVAPGDF